MTFRRRRVLCSIETDMKHGAYSNSIFKSSDAKESHGDGKLNTVNTFASEIAAWALSEDTKKGTYHKKVSAKSEKIPEGLEVSSFKNFAKEDSNITKNSELFINYHEKSRVSFPVIKNVFTLSSLPEEILKTQLDFPITPPRSPSLIYKENARHQVVLHPSITYYSCMQEKSSEILERKKKEHCEDGNVISFLTNSIEIGPPHIKSSYQNSGNEVNFLNYLREDSTQIHDADYVFSEEKHSSDVALTAHEHKVFQLKRKLQEQELALKRLRTQF